MRVKINLIVFAYFLLTLFNSHTSSYARNNSDNVDNREMESSIKIKREGPISLYFNYYGKNYEESTSISEEDKNMILSRITIIFSNIIGYNETKTEDNITPEINLIHDKEGLVLSSLYSNWIWDRQMVNHNYEVLYDSTTSELWKNTKQIKVFFLLIYL